MDQNIINISSAREGVEICPIFKQAIQDLRDERNKKLGETDFLMCLDVFESFDTEKQEKIKLYRKNLRNLLNDIMDDKIEFKINLSPHDIIIDAIGEFNL